MDYNIRKIINELEDIISSMSDSMEDNLIKIRLKLLKDEIRNIK